MEEKINLELAMVYQIYWNCSPSFERNDLILQAALSSTFPYILYKGVYCSLVNHHLLS